MADILFSVTTVYAEELSRIEAEIKAKYLADFESWKVAYMAGIDEERRKARNLGTENLVHWICGTLAGGGLLAYGIWKADPVIGLSGAAMVLAGGLRLVIEL